MMKAKKARTVPLTVTNAASIAVSPPGQDVTVSGTSPVVSAAQECSQTYTVTVSSSTGHTASRSSTLLVEAAEQPDPNATFAVDSDGLEVLRVPDPVTVAGPFTFITDDRKP